jgi:pulcherriminic acid synthase
MRAESDERPVEHSPVVTELGPIDSVNDVAPWEYYERARAAGDIVWNEDQGMWFVSSYDLLTRLYHADHLDWEQPFVYDPANLFGMTQDEWIEFIGPGPLALSLQPAQAYERMHAWWFRMFSRRVLARWGDTLIEPIANEELDAFAARGTVEFCSEYNYHVTGRIMLAVLGIPSDDVEWIDRFIALHRGPHLALLDYQAGTQPPRSIVDAGLGAVREMQAMILPFVEAKRAGTDDDFIGMIWRDADELFGGAPYDERDVLAHAMAAFNGGAGSVGSVLGNTLYLVLTTPGLQERALSGGLATIQRLVEEAARLYSNVDWRTRRAKRDLTLGNVTIKKGEWVLAINAAGNRDEKRFACPYDVVLERSAPRDHFGYGKGPRICPGQALARFQLERIVALTLRRLPELRLDESADEPRWRGGLTRQWTPLHACFQPVDGARRPS